MLSDKLSNAGCNDFELKKFFDCKEDQEAFVRSVYQWNGTPNDFDPNDLELPDFMVVDFLVSCFKKHLDDEQS